MHAAKAEDTARRVMSSVCTRCVRRGERVFTCGAGSEEAVWLFRVHAYQTRGYRRNSYASPDAPAPRAAHRRNAGSVRFRVPAGISAGRAHRGHRSDEADCHRLCVPFVLLQARKSSLLKVPVDFNGHAACAGDSFADGNRCNQKVNHFSRQMVRGCILRDACMHTVTVGAEGL